MTYEQCLHVSSVCAVMLIVAIYGLLRDFQVCIVYYLVVRSAVR